MQTHTERHSCWFEESCSGSSSPFVRPSPRKHPHPHPCSASTDTGSPPRRHTWKAYWTRSSKRYLPLDSPVFCKRRKINKKAGHFRKKGCPNYELLGLLFNGSTATGVLRHSSARTPPGSEEEEELNDALLRFGMHVSREANASLGNGVDSVEGSGVGSTMLLPLVGGVVIGGNGRGKRPVDSSGPNSDYKRKGKGKESSSMDSLRSDALKEFRDLSRLKKEMLIQNQQRMSSGGEASGGGASSGVSFSNSMSRAIAILDEIAPDLDDERYLRAFNLLRHG